MGHPSPQRKPDGRKRVHTESGGEIRKRSARRAREAEPYRAKGADTRPEPPAFPDGECWGLEHGSRAFAPDMAALFSYGSDAGKADYFIHTISHDIAGTDPASRRRNTFTMI